MNLSVKVICGPPGNAGHSLNDDESALQPGLNNSSANPLFEMGLCSYSIVQFGSECAFMFDTSFLVNPVGMNHQVAHSFLLVIM